MSNGVNKSRGNGHAHDEPGAIVDAAVEAIRREHAEAGEYADLAAGFMTAGEGYGVITQSRLQEFLWYMLPRA